MRARDYTQNHKTRHCLSIVNDRFIVIHNFFTKALFDATLHMCFQHMVSSLTKIKKADKRGTIWQWYMNLFYSRNENRAIWSVMMTLYKPLWPYMTLETKIVCKECDMALIWTFWTLDINMGLKLMIGLWYDNAFYLNITCSQCWKCISYILFGVE
jgi:hypothetical protein